MGAIHDKMIQNIAKYLTEEGRKLIVKAFNEADFKKNKTQNLHDSYGSCVFYKGKEVFNSRRYVGRLATVGKIDPQGDLVLGRAEIDEFFDNYSAKKEGFELVIAAAIFYGQILENKKKRKYKVISHMADEVKALSAKLKGSTVYRFKGITKEEIKTND